MKIDTVIFDLDGVIIDSEYQYLLLQLEVLIEDGLDIHESDLYPLVGLEWDLHFDYLAKLYDYKKTPSEIKDDYHRYYDEHTIEYKDWIFPNFRNTLDTLKRHGFNVAVASNSDTETIEAVLTELEIIDHFDVYLGADQVKQGKPFPDIYLEAMHRLDKNKESVLVLEDSYSGIKAGKDAGLKVFAIEDTKFNMDQSQADKSLKDISEILKILNIES